MNTERYILPVVIAAGLHGALFLGFPDRNPPPPPDEEEAAVVLPPLPRMEMTDPLPVDPDAEGGGRADPIPAQIDIPRPASPTGFTVPVMPSAPSIWPVVTLPDNPSGPIGPGEPGHTGRPRLPDVCNLDRIPRATVQPAPAYPDTMRKSATDGSVTVEFIVDTTGRVVAAGAVRWSHREFVDPAVAAVRRWRFEPGTLDGRKVSFRMAVPIEFNAAP
jgi:protein TonB